MDKITEKKTKNVTQPEVQSKVIHIDEFAEPLTPEQLKAARCMLKKHGMVVNK